MSLSVLSQKSVIVILAYSPTGLGHLRVTDALYEGLPEEVTPVLLGSQDKAVSAVFRFISIHPLTRKIFELGQRGNFQYIVTYFYQRFLRTRTKLLYQQITTILDERLEIPSTLVFVATHFGLAHQIGEIKQKLIKEKNIRVQLFVQVTDDSPQPIWYVPEADLIFVPSEHTKEHLQAFAKRFHLRPAPFLVTPYPVSPSFSIQLSTEKHHNRISQVDIQNTSHIHLSLPVPGAAIGTAFLTKLIGFLHEKSDRFIFHIIAKQAPYTTSFLSKMVELPYVHLHVSTHDRETVRNYEHMYDNNVISLEVTKPSEQSFKTLLTPLQKGGSILLFAQPVGRQEYDNISFLHRHHLIPAPTVQKMLWEKAWKQETLDNTFGREVKKAAKGWRGMLLPFHSLQSSVFITWCMKEGLFTEMMHYNRQTHTQDLHEDELKGDGVEQFWHHVATMTDNKM